jgi:zinc/manganese transport system substrate-binding protein/zinc transport system substrate-binding protein
VVTPRGVTTGGVDRSHGHVHPLGNPHFLLDPVNGLKVARAIRDRLIALRPEKKESFEKRHDDFSRRLKEALVGEKLATKYDPEKIATLGEYGKLEEFLESQNDSELLGGWLGRMARLRGTRVVAEHNTWLYFSERFGLEVIGFLEPKPGISPTTKHLLELVKEMKASGARGILTVPYFDRRHSRFVAQETGAIVIPLAHQVGARPGTDDYISMLENNVRQIEKALKVE